MTQDLLTKIGSSVLLIGDSAQTPDLQCTLGAGLANAAGRIAARWDRGANALPEEYFALLSFQLQAAGTLGTAGELWVGQGDGTIMMGELGTSDAALTSVNQLRNCDLVVPTINQASGSNTRYTRGGLILLCQRYISFVVYNNTGQTFRADTSTNFIRVWSKYSQLQNNV